MPEVGFEPTPTNRIELKSTALDHSAIQACNINFVVSRDPSYESRNTRHDTTAEGFEPPRAEPIRFRI